MRHVDFPGHQDRSGDDRRDLYPECHSPAKLVRYGTTQDRACCGASTEQDIDSALVQTSVGERHEIGDDNSLIRLWLDG